MLCPLCEKQRKVLITFKVEDIDKELVNRYHTTVNYELSLCPECYVSFVDHKYVRGKYPNKFIDLYTYLEEE